MVKISTTAKQIAAKYVENLSSQLVIKQALLFGSIARGEMTPHSDIDLIILSDQFRGMPLMKRLVMLSRARGKDFLDWPMDILGYTASEFEKLSKVSDMFKEVKEQGLVIK